MKNRQQMKPKPLIVIKPKNKHVEQSTYNLRFKQLFKMCQQLRTKTNVANSHQQMQEKQKRAVSNRSYRSVLPEIKQKEMEEQQIPENSFHTTRTHADHRKQLSTALNSRDRKKDFRSVGIPGRVTAFKQSDARANLQIDVRKLIATSKNKQAMHNRYKSYCK